MGFVFRLAKVARYRQQLVDEKGRVVAAAQRVVAGLEARIAGVDEDIKRHLHDFQDETAPAISVQGMMARTMWVTHLEKVRQRFELELREAQAEVFRQRAELSEVWRDLEVLNKLREKQKAVWQAEQAKRESQDLDEIGQIRADRQRRSKVAS